MFCNLFCGGGAIPAVNAPATHVVSEFGNSKRVRLAAGEPTSPQMSVSAIAILRRDRKLEAFGDSRDFLGFPNNYEVLVFLNKTNVHICCVPVTTWRLSHNRLCGTDHQLITFAVQSQARLDINLPRVNGHLEAGHYAEAMQAAVMSFEFGAKVFLLELEVLGGQYLAYEVTKAFEVF